MRHHFLGILTFLIKMLLEKTLYRMASVYALFPMISNIIIFLYRCSSRVVKKRYRVRSFLSQPLPTV